MLKKSLRLLSLVVLLSAMSFATAVRGTLVNGSGNPLPGGTLTLTLSSVNLTGATVSGCGDGTAPNVRNSGTITQMTTVITAGAGGALFGTVVGNDQINCGTGFGVGTFYVVTAKDPTGVQQWSHTYNVTGATWTPSATPLSVLPPSILAVAIVANPAGNQTIVQPGGTSLTINGILNATLTGNATTATALAANGSNCSAGSFAAGVDASGNAEGCTPLPTSIAGTVNQVNVSASTGAITLSLPQSIATTSSPVFGGLTINGTGTISTLSSASVSVNATANAADLLTLKRFTDTAPTGNFVRFKNAAGTDLYLVDINGNATAASFTTAGSVTFTTANYAFATPTLTDGTGGLWFNNNNVFLKAGGIDTFGVFATGVSLKGGLSLGFNATAGASGASPDTLIFRGATAGVIGIGTAVGTFNGTVNAGAYQVNSVALSAANLSNGTTGSGAVMLATTPTAQTSLIVSATNPVLQLVSTFTTPSTNQWKLDAVGNVDFSANSSNATISEWAVNFGNTGNNFKILRAATAGGARTTLLTLDATGNLNITGGYQVGGAALNFTNLAGSASIAQGGTAQTTFAVGDLLVGTSGSLSRLAIGATGLCLTSNGTTAVWGSCSTGAAALAATQTFTGVNTFSNDVIINGNAGLPASSGNALFLAGTFGSPVAGRVLFSDCGSCPGWHLKFGARANSTNGDQFTLFGTSNGGFFGVDSPIPLTPPTTSLVTGGTLASGTPVFYKITAIGADGGETEFMPEVTATPTGTTLSVQLTWTAVPGAASYKIYRGTTAGGENAFQTSTTSPFTDTGAAGTAGTPPTFNNSYLVKLKNGAGSYSIFGISLGQTATAAYMLDVLGNTNTSANQLARFKSGTSSDAFVLLDTTTASNQALIQYADAGTIKWVEGKGTTNGFVINDQGAAVDRISLTQAGNNTYSTGNVSGVHTFQHSDASLATINAGGYQVSGVALSASNLSNGVTGTGAVMLAASPTTTGTLTAATVNATAYQIGGVDYSAVTKTFTNTTIDAEGTGNNITSPVKLWYEAAGCNNASPTPFWDTSTATVPSAVCVTGTNVVKGLLRFAVNTQQFAQFHYLLPADLKSATTWDLNLLWTTATVSGTATFQVDYACTTVGSTATDDPAFTAWQTISATASATANAINKQSVTGATTTCTAGQIMHFRVKRTDTAGTATNADVYGLELTYRRTM